MKRFLVVFSLIFAAFSYSFAEDKVTDSLKTVTNTFNDIIPSNNTLMNIQPDAYIGKLYPSIPAHFSFGISVAGTLIKTGFVNDFVNSFNNEIESAVRGTPGNDEASVKADFELPDSLPIPAAAFAFRLGGIKLPFDLGFYGTTTASLIPEISKDDFGFDLSVTSFGAEIRYALLKGNLLLPKISIGGGYSYTTMDLSLSMKTSFDYSGLEKKATMNGNINLNVTNQVLYAQAQISKKILCFIPYAGARINFISKGYDIDWKYDSKDISLEGKGKNSSSGNFDCMETMLFGGLGIKTGYFEFAVNAAYNLNTNYITGGIGLNFLR